MPPPLTAGPPDRSASCREKEREGGGFLQWHLIAQSFIKHNICSVYFNSTGVSVFITRKTATNTDQTNTVHVRLHD